MAASEHRSTTFAPEGSTTVVRKTNGAARDWTRLYQREVFAAAGWTRRLKGSESDG